MWKPDAYYVIARLSPAVILLVPAGVTAWVVYSEEWPSIPSPIYLLLFPIVTFPLSGFVRSKGKEIQRILWSEWGGSPLAISLATPTNNSANVVRQRAIVRLKQLFPDAIRTNGSVSVYEAVGSLIAAYTTDLGTSVIASENRTYGFYRNSYGIRRTGILTSIACVLVLGVFSFFSQQSELWFALLVVGSTFAWWIFGVKKKNVREAGDRYADAVIRWLGSSPLD